MKEKRMSKDMYYLNIAKDVSKRGTCLRRNFGAVIVNNDAIVSTGYTGAPRGTTSSLDAGWCWREKHKIPPGERYELCRSVHAEMNAIIHAGRDKCLGGTLYLCGIDAKTGEITGHEPCLMCTKMIINAGLKRVVVLKSDNDYVSFDNAEMTRRFEKQFEKE